jgi:hypothetical protein
MRYGHVTNGVIDAGPRLLPNSWENISGLNNMTNEDLLPLGWLPWIFITVPVEQNQVLDGSTVVINSADIVETQIVRDLTPGEIQARDQQEQDTNKRQAEARLNETDWASIPDVSDPDVSDPYLANAAEFVAYRSQLRKIAVNPPVIVNEWPVKPDEVWTAKTS